ncbi:response regulator [Rheinheimera baltica]|uniref:Hpt domain-containing response regulator n=1 Tax=Rheinheimera baltica TaxID=67576 RepID=UPI00273F692F|nr:response regulator [Rheinheimera baltica]MDP5141701.1 response regulator [Rheinheimera baltica]
MSSRKHILIAEDDDFMRSLLSSQCAGLGLTVHSVENGEQAITEALSYQYDIVLTDIQMPLCDGTTVMRILRQLGYDRPIIAMSADEIPTEGFDLILSKPFDAAMLAEVIQRTAPQKSVPLLIDDELTNLFYQNLSQLRQTFEDALKHSEREVMRQVCHKIKGGAASFGETTLAELAGSLQMQLFSDVALDELLNNCNRFLDALSQTGKHDVRT